MSSRGKKSTVKKEAECFPWQICPDLYEQKLLKRSTLQMHSQKLLLPELPNTMHNSYNDLDVYRGSLAALRLEEDRAAIARSMLVAKRIGGLVTKLEQRQNLSNKFFYVMIEFPGYFLRKTEMLPRTVVLLSLEAPSFTAEGVPSAETDRCSVFGCVKQRGRRSILVKVEAPDLQRETVAQHIANKLSNGGRTCDVFVSVGHALCESLRSIEALWCLRTGTVVNTILSLDGEPDNKAPTAKQIKSFERKMSGLQMNPSQRDAAFRACDLLNHPITLIQGPPGTGKSRTSAAIIANIASQLEKGEKVMVCAVTNKAVQSLAGMFLKHVVDGVNSLTKQFGLALTRRDIALAAARDAVHTDNEDMMSILVNQKVVDVSNNALLLCRFVSQLSEYLEQLIQAKPAQIDNFKLQWKEAVEAHATLGKLLPLPSNVTQSLYEVYADYKKMIKTDWEHAKTVDLLKRVRELQCELKDSLPHFKKKVKLSNLHFQRQRNTRDTLIGMVFRQARVVFCTTATAGSTTVRRNTAVRVVLIDEAAQLLETQMLIPVSTGCKKLILVGDPKQLPATVVSQLARQRRYHRPLFQRMLDQGYKGVKLLNQQYRMNPAIARFSNHAFYGSRIGNGPNVQSDEWKWQNKFPAMQNAERKHLFGTTRFFDLIGRTKVSVGKSRYNRVEARAMANYIRTIVECIAVSVDTIADFEAISIGMMSPYRAQIEILQHEVKKALLKHSRKLARDADSQHSEFDVYKIRKRLLSAVTFGSVDSFQGSEYDIVLFSCVRSHKATRSIGFVADVQRANVGLTRAKHMLAVFGNAGSLSVASVWAQLLTMWRGRKQREHPQDRVLQQVDSQLNPVDNSTWSESSEVTDTSDSDSSEASFGAVTDESDFSDSDFSDSDFSDSDFYGGLLARVARSR